MTDEKFPKKNKIRRSREYREHFRRAIRLESSDLLLFFRLTDQSLVRLGLTVGRQAGKAHVRNKLKRRLREIFRRSKAGWESRCEGQLRGFDVVIKPKPGASEVSFQELEQQVKQTVERFLRDPFRPNQRRGKTKRKKKDEERD